MKSQCSSHIFYLALFFLLFISSNIHASELRVSGASTIYPILDSLSSSLSTNAGTVMQLSGGGSGRGISDVREGVSDIGMVSRGLRADEIQDLQYTTIALDTLVFVVNDANPLKEINHQQLVSIYTRQVSWEEINNFSWPVILVSKEIGRSTLDLFEEFTGLTSPERPNPSGRTIDSNAVVIGSNLEALTLVGGLQGGVGYVSLGAAASMRDAGLPIRILSLNAIEPSAQTINSGQYPIRRELNLVYLERTPEIDSLLRLISSPQGLEAISNAGFIPTGGR
ncbi:substrate-binding domain-containing protein [Nitrincola schmidtii]|uniref:substrate-binding domain-containing protein n=1 Tax=Nitrincola schmidtii TaxID=1730894 RepID=UPI00124F69BD|nr:substrate-binding domain-containing protein [Nitrincola schmidtii]